MASTSSATVVSTSTNSTFAPGPSARHDGVSSTTTCLTRRQDNRAPEITPVVENTESMTAEPSATASTRVTDALSTARRKNNDASSTAANRTTRTGGRNWPRERPPVTIGTEAGTLGNGSSGGSNSENIYRNVHVTDGRVITAIGQLPVSPIKVVDGIIERVAGSAARPSQGNPRARAGAHPGEMWVRGGGRDSDNISRSAPVARPLTTAVQETQGAQVGGYVAAYLAAVGRDKGVSSPSMKDEGGRKIVESTAADRQQANSRSPTAKSQSSTGSLHSDRPTWALRTRQLASSVDEKNSPSAEKTTTTTTYPRGIMKTGSLTTRETAPPPSLRGDGLSEITVVPTANTARARVVIDPAVPSPQHSAARHNTGREQQRRRRLQQKQQKQQSRSETSRMFSHNNADNQDPSEGCSSTIGDTSDDAPFRKYPPGSKHFPDTVTAVTAAGVTTTAATAPSALSAGSDKNPPRQGDRHRSRASSPSAKQITLTPTTNASVVTLSVEGKPATARTVSGASSDHNDGRHQNAARQRPQTTSPAIRNSAADRIGNSMGRVFSGGGAKSLSPSSTSGGFATTTNTSSSVRAAR